MYKEHTVKKSDISIFSATKKFELGWNDPKECLMISHFITKCVDITLEFRLLRNIDVLGQSFIQSR
jgi:hypothetical protein